MAFVPDAESEGGAIGPDELSDSLTHDPGDGRKLACKREALNDGEEAISWVGWRRGAPGWRAIHLGVLVALLAILVHGAIDNPYFKNDLSVEFWALVALTWAGRRWGRPPASGGG